MSRLCLSITSAIVSKILSFLVSKTLHIITFFNSINFNRTLHKTVFGEGHSLVCFERGPKQITKGKKSCWENLLTTLTKSFCSITGSIAVLPGTKHSGIHVCIKDGPHPSQLWEKIVKIY